ncbi:MAG: aminotransferase class V-fold PLP-dependent enzyme [candidate division KSB1 bacterium]|jgi:phosphoserine aminotransferase|nr:aminotransferase class V-fold PLP-dependent enzyme [candidate division KSB1 bacterium]
MRCLYFTPGPTALYPTVPEHIRNALADDVCSISHRSKAFMAISKRTEVALRALLDIPDSHVIFYPGSATEAMERIIENCVAERSHHFVNGAFSRRFFDMALALKKRPEKTEASFGTGFDFRNVGIGNDVELICVTQNETSAGVALRVDDILDLKRRYPEALMAVDIVSSVPYVDLDYSVIDCAFFSVQKGFGLPAGLGVLIVNEACIARSEALRSRSVNIGSYHSFPSLNKYAAKHQTPETPNVLGIYLLGRVCEDMLETGLDRIRAGMDQKAEMLYSAFERHPELKPFVEEPDIRSKTVIVGENPPPKLKEYLRSKGFIIGSGYGDYREHHIRIANFPQHREEDVARLVALLG